MTNPEEPAFPTTMIKEIEGNSFYQLGNLITTVEVKKTDYPGLTKLKKSSQKVQ